MEVWVGMCVAMQEGLGAIFVNLVNLSSLPLKALPLSHTVPVLNTSQSWDHVSCVHGENNLVLFNPVSSSLISNL